MKAGITFPEHVHVDIKTEQEYILLEKFLNEEKDCFAFDIETDRLDWWSTDGVVVGLGFAFLRKDKKIYTFYLPLNHNSCANHAISSVVYRVLRGPIPKVGANIKFDCHWMLAKYDVVVSPVDDVQIAARLLRTDYRSVALDSLVENDFGDPYEEYTALLKTIRKLGYTANQKGIEPGAMRHVPLNVVGPYCGKDVYWTLLLWLRYRFEMKREPSIAKMYDAIERPLIEAVLSMERTGVRVDVEYLQKIKAELTEHVKQLEVKIYEIAGESFDIDSPKQLLPILKRRGVVSENRRRKKKDGSVVETPSYDKAALAKAKNDPFVTFVLEYRETNKFLSSFVDGILKRVDETGKIHTQIKQERARTGRFGCAEPNLMNIPREDETSEFRTHNSIRRAFLPFEGKKHRFNRNVLLAIDYSQIEYRLLAHFSKEPKLVKSFLDGQDFHGVVASQLYDVEFDKVEKKQRSVAKTFNFAQLYGSGVPNLSVKTGIPLEKCREMVNKYGKLFPGVVEFKRSVEKYCVENGGIKNPFGRFRQIPSDKAYTAVNTLIQGTAADILKIAIIRVHNYLKDKLSKLLLPVHDELIINWDFRDGDILTTIQKLMTSFVKDGKYLWRIPLDVSASICELSWQGKRDVTDYDLMDAAMYNAANADDLLHEAEAEKTLLFIVNSLRDKPPPDGADILREVRVLLEQRGTGQEVEECLLRHGIAITMPAMPWEPACAEGGEVGQVPLFEEAAVPEDAAGSWT